LTIIRDFLRFLRDPDYSVFSVVWLEAKHINEHVANIEEHLLLLIKDKDFPVDQRVDDLDYSQFFKFRHVA
jgi:hypothetical protein